ncbi:hypothetical protein BGZ94_008771 [Podila epigama]|nr:hypothetical protein BGZ94_008771 [Podila epigama]
MSTNIFDLLNDDAQDQEIHIPAVTKAAPKPKAAATGHSGAGASASHASSARPADHKGPRKDGQKPSRPRRETDDRDRGGPRGPRYDRTPRAEGEPAPRPFSGSRNSTRGGRGGRHGGYDRHSGTGIIDSEKKEIKGWGEPTMAALQGAQDADNEVSRAPSPEPAEPEAPVKTLDDYLQEKAAKALKISLPKARSANAGADESQWKGAKVLQVEETGDFIKMGKDAVVKGRKGKKEGKVLVQDIDIRFAEPAREPSARRGRGGGRGGRGCSAEPRHAFRGNAHRRDGHGGASSVDVEDPSSFPTLGSA